MIPRAVGPTIIVAAAAVLAACSASDFYGLGAGGCDVDGDASAGIQGSLTKQAGDGQTAAPGSVLSVRVRLVAVNGGALCEKPVIWTTGAGSGSVQGQATTGSNGDATASWTLGANPGTQSLTATIGNSVPTLSVTFTATATGEAHPVAEISAYNGTTTTGVLVTMTTPFNGAVTFGPLGLNVQSIQSLQVEAGVAFEIEATVGTLTGSTTCTTTAAIIPDPNDPTNTGSALVGVFIGESAEVMLTCNGAWE
jgi:hypothetical protein